MSKKIRNRRASIAGRYLDKLAEKELAQAYQESGGGFIFSDRLYNKWIIGRALMTQRRQQAIRRRRDGQQSERLARIAAEGRNSCDTSSHN